MVGGEVFQMWLATISRPEGSNRSLPIGSTWTVDGTVFEMWRQLVILPTAISMESSSLFGLAGATRT